MIKEACVHEAKSPRNKWQFLKEKRCNDFGVHVDLQKVFFIGYMYYHEFSHRCFTENLSKIPKQAGIECWSVKLSAGIFIALLNLLDLSHDKILEVCSSVSLKPFK